MKASLRLSVGWVERAKSLFPDCKSSVLFKQQLKVNGEPLSTSGSHKDKGLTVNKKKNKTATWALGSTSY